MSYDNDQTESPLPAGNNSNRKSADLLPKYFSLAMPPEKAIPINK